MKSSILIKTLFTLICTAGTASVLLAEDPVAPAAPTPAAPAAPAAAPTAAPTDEPAAAAPQEQPAPPKEAKPEPFRQGLIYSAELSGKKPEIQDAVALDQPAADAKIVWAELVVKCPAGRGLSRFDFSLVKDDKVFSCLAVAEQDEAYSQKKEAWLFESETAPQNEQTGRKLDHTKFYRMLFAVPADQVNEDALQTFRLKFNYTFKQKDQEVPTQFKDKEISFRLLPGETPFTLTAAIPQNGSYGLTADEVKQLKEQAEAPASVPVPEQPAAPAPAPAK